MTGVTGEHYEGGHWLGTSRRGTSNPAVVCRFPPARDGSEARLRMFLKRHYKLSHKQRERAEASEPRERSGASGSPRASV